MTPFPEFPEIALGCPWPRSFRAALSRIAAAYGLLIEQGFLDPLSDTIPDREHRGIFGEHREPRPFHWWMPPYWRLYPPEGYNILQLEVGGAMLDRIEYELEQDRLRLLFRGAQEVRREASRDWKAIEFSVEVFWQYLEVAGEHKSPIHPAALKALFKYRDTLDATNFYRNSVTEEVVALLDQYLEMLFGAARQMLLYKLFHDGWDSDVGREAIALLQQCADDGRWPDPQADMERAAELAVSRAA